MFKYVVLATAVFIAACAAWFSVTGIAQLYSVGTFAVALELGKLVTVSLLYRYWNDFPRMLRYYLSAGLLILIAITSFGIYGYLTAAYASSAVTIQNTQNQVGLYTTQQITTNEQITRLTDRARQLEQGRIQQENRLDTLVAKGRSITAQQTIIKNQDNELATLRTQITTLSNRRDSLSTQITSTKTSITSDVKIGTFYYIAQAFHLPLDTVVKWFTLIIVLVFDPLSICLFFGYNVILKKERMSDVAQVSNLSAISPVENLSVAMINSRESHTHQAEESNTAEEVIGDVAPDDDQSLPNLDTINTTELDTTPYYMHPDFDWKHDLRWRTDVSARMHYGRLGMPPDA